MKTRGVDIGLALKKTARFKKTARRIVDLQARVRELEADNKILLEFARKSARLFTNDSHEYMDSAIWMEWADHAKIVIRMVSHD